MYRDLAFLHPQAWHASQPPKRWDLISRSWVFRPSLAQPERVVEQYENYLFGVLLSHALALLNRHGWRDEDGEVFMSIDVGLLAAALAQHAREAGSAVDVRFTPGRARPRHMLDGDFSTRWLDRATERISQLALLYWEPEEATRVRERKAAGGRRSKRTSNYMPRDLPHGSIKAQAEALNVSRSTIARLRRQARALAA